MSTLDNRQEALGPEAPQGVVRVDDSMKLADETTPSTAVLLNVNISAGVIVIAPKVQQFNLEADFLCGTAITDLNSKPIAIVAAYNPAIDSIVRIPVAGTEHLTPAAPADSRAYYPTEAEIQAALPADIDSDHGWTLVGVAVFKRAGATVTQHYDHAVRSWGLITSGQHPAVAGTAPDDERLTSGDQF